MLRRTAAQYIKPYLHVFSPGRTAAEKGSLYRNNNQNAHARLINIHPSQRTLSEKRKLRYLLLPDQSFLMALLVCCSCVGIIMSYRTMPMAAQHHRERWVQGGLSQHERYIRRDEMDIIFEAHRELVANTQNHAKKPEVFSAPGAYKSESGIFA